MIVLKKGPRAGFNPRTGASPQMNPSRSRSANDYSRQGEQFVRQSPEPFRNPQPSANPLRNPGSMTPQGMPYWETTEPGKHPNRAPGRSPMSTQQMMTATGHKPSYEPAGYSPLTSGHPTRRPAKNNNPNAGRQPQAKSQFKTNRDIFNEETMRDFRRL